MFANFLYFLFALILYASADLFEVKNVPAADAILYGTTCSVGFWMLCQICFKRLKKQLAQDSFERVDHFTHLYMRRLSILALVVFALDIYVFKVNQIFSEVVFFKWFPTFEALLFLSVFLLYLVFIWQAAYPVQRRYLPDQLSKNSYLFSNITFSLPALLPWFVISIFADCLAFLPWPEFNKFFQSTAGQAWYMAFFLVAIAIFGPVLIKQLWNCKPLEHGYARHRIEQVCEMAGLQYSDILKWELFGGSMITAGIMGLVGKVRYILVTPALLGTLNEDELEAVVLHEIGHVQKYHMLFYMLFFAGFVACSFVFFDPIIMLLQILKPVYDFLSHWGIPPQTAYPLFIVITLLGSFVCYFRLGFGFFMRNFERQADLHVYNFKPDASALISTFYKIAYYSRQAMDKPNWHHFSIGERVRFLEQCQLNPELIRMHHKKVKKMMTVFLILMSSFIYSGYAVQYGPAKTAFSMFIAEKIVLQQMDINLDNVDMFVYVGGYFYEKKEYQKTIDVYENVLKVDNQNITALNNLAWLYATCPQEQYQDKNKALLYAAQAVELKKEDYILDTYAEALFINGDIEKAVAIAREAIDLSKGDATHFKQQLKRFEQHL